MICYFHVVEAYYIIKSARCKVFLAVLSGDYCVVLPDCTSSTYYSTPPGGSRQTPCTNPKSLAKKKKNSTLRALRAQRT